MDGRRLTINPAHQLLQSLHFLLDAGLSKRIVVLKRKGQTKSTGTKRLIFNKRKPSETARCVTSVMQRIKNAGKGGRNILKPKSQYSFSKK